jgi:tetratricopeptide (TPR) repeat protein
VPVEGWDPEVTHPSASLGRQLIATMEARGLPAALEENAAIRAKYGADTELAINELGYALLAGGRTADAIAVFTLNTTDHPGSANAWDSLAEAHRAAGDRERAVELYRKSLDLNPDNANAKRMLEELGAR